MFTSIQLTFKDILHGKVKDAFSDDYRNANLKLATHDLLMGMFFTYLITMLFTGGSGNKKDVSPENLIAYSIMTKALNEFNPVTSIVGLAWEPSWYKTTLNLLKNGPDVLAGNKELGGFITKNFVAMKDWDLDQSSSKPETKVITLNQ